MLGSVFRKKCRTEDLKNDDIRRVAKKYVNMGLQAALLTSAALTAEVGALKQDLERSEQELGRAKKQLEDKEGE
jgi:hypothetical protein